MYLPVSSLHKSFTLIELLVVLSIIIITTAATLPSFLSFAEKRNFENKIDDLYAEFRAIQNKSLSGATFGATRVSWGIIPTCEGSTYSFGHYTGAGNPVADRTHTLPANLTFAATGTDCGNMFFERLTGKPLTTGSFRSRLRVNYSGGTYTKVFVVNSSGQINIQ